MYVAAENLWRSEFSHRWMLTFGFGLGSRFGFASVLRELVSSLWRTRALASFVQSRRRGGQIVIVGLLLAGIVGG